MHGGLRRPHAVGQVAAGAGVCDHLAHRPGRMLALDRDQQLGDLRRQPARPTAVGTCLGIQGIEAAAPVVLQQPVAQSLGGHAGAQRVRNGVPLLGLGPRLVSDPWRAGRQMDQVGGQAVAVGSRSPVSSIWVNSPASRRIKEAESLPYDLSAHRVTRAVHPHQRPAAHRHRLDLACLESSLRQRAQQGSLLAETLCHGATVLIAKDEGYSACSAASRYLIGTVPMLYY